MLGVTGPNEYENNVNNNWYTSKMALWTLKLYFRGSDGVQRQPKTRCIVREVKLQRC